MLTHLNIQGLAIIESVSIDFTKGFNVITGETGAGKSILIKALNFLLGAKASPDTVRRGRDVASVSATFHLPANHRAIGVLEALGIPADDTEDGFEVIVRRNVSAKGKSQAWINDLPVTMGSLKDFAEVLIDVFAQHENQRMLDPHHHMSYVDQFLRDPKSLHHYQRIYEKCQTDIKSLREMCEDFRSRKRDGDYLAFRCEELNKFDPSLEDYEQTKSLCDKAGKFLNMAASLQRAQACLDEGAGGDALGKPLRELTKILSGLGAVSPEIAALAEDASDIAQRVEDLSFKVGRLGGNVDVDEGELEQAQERLAGYQALLRKMSAHEVTDLLAEWERLLNELKFIENAASEANFILMRLKSASVELEVAAQALSKARHKAGKEISKAVEGELKDLAMPGAALEVRFEPVQKDDLGLDISVLGDHLLPVWNDCSATLTKMGDCGNERAQLYLASNPGEPSLPLQKIASGGEVSRIMLAFKKALAAGADTCILVFDEIDTGISGRVADVVGQKLKELARHVQIICISHLPQVAAYGETHFLVHKYGKDSRTESTISRLSTKESAEEIARLLSGNEVNATSLANAKNLIMKASSRTC